MSEHTVQISDASFEQDVLNATGPVLVDGVATKLVGRVSMDMLTVDLSAIPGARVGSRVVLWGAGLPIDDVATAAGTIGYELMCA